MISLTKNQTRSMNQFHLQNFENNNILSTTTVKHGLTSKFTREEGYLKRIKRRNKYRGRVRGHLSSSKKRESCKVSREKNSPIFPSFLPSFLDGVGTKLVLFLRLITKMKEREKRGKELLRWQCCWFQQRYSSCLVSLCGQCFSHTGHPFFGLFPCEQKARRIRILVYLYMYMCVCVRNFRFEQHGRMTKNRGTKGRQG